MENVFEYSRSGEKAELVIRDYSGAKVETFKWNLNDKNNERKVFSIVRRKYGMFKPEINPEDKDLDWLRKK